MEAMMKGRGLAAITVELLFAMKAIQLRIELILDVISVTQTYAATVFQYAEIPKIPTASTQRSSLTKNHLNLETSP